MLRIEELQFTFVTERQNCRRDAMQLINRVKWVRIGVLEARDCWVTKADLLIDYKQDSNKTCACLVR